MCSTSLAVKTDSTSTLQKRAILALMSSARQVLRPAKEDVRLDTDFPEGLHAVLGGFGLDLACRFDERDPGQVDEDGVLLAHLVAELPDGLQEGQAFDIADGAADLDDGHVEALAVGPWMKSLISLVMWGMTWTVLPR